MTAKTTRTRVRIGRHVEIFRASREMRDRQLARLAAYRAARDRKALAKAVDGVREAAAKDENVMGPIIDALRAHATEGEVMGALKDVYGEFQPETAY